MSINLSVPHNKTEHLKPRITVIGVGGGGGNAVNNMIAKQLEGIDFVVANTDAQALSNSHAVNRIQLGVGITQGLGAGSHPEIGAKAAEEALAEIEAQLEGVNMAFIAAGMGGGTGTGAAPVIARAARERGILTVGVVTKPFQFEGAHRMQLAEEGLKELEEYVDTMIVIPNQNLFRIANEKTTFADAFNMADEVLYSGVRGVTDLMVMPGLINLDFADIRSVMSGMGKAMMGTGEAEGERRALDAAEAAISNPLLDDTSMAGAKGVLINITGGQDMTLFETDEAANRIRSEVDEDAYIIFGSTFDESLEGRVRVSVVATGMDGQSVARPSPTFLSVDMAPKPRRSTSPKPEAKTEPEESSVFVKMAGIATASDRTGQEEEDLVIPSPERSYEEARIELNSKIEELGISEPEATSEPETEELEEASMDSPEPVEETSADIDPGQPVVATPGTNMGDAFIPSAPMSASGEEAPKAAEPFAAAAMANAGKGQEEARTEAQPSPAKLTLFERVTGIAGAGKAAITPTPEQAPVAELAAPAPAPEPEITGEDSQDKLGGLGESDRIQPAQADEDLLDIPAFLRRQAN
ncbi:MAG: cell division protein FtsZ [Rhodospirillaceae bacterium]|nr:cell division protein FtsZ [Rhodospirillaceae bacterium]